MTTKISKGNDVLANRLSEVRLSDHERIRAEAQLARAEAIAEMLATVAKGITGLFKTTPTRTATHAG